MKKPFSFLLIFLTTLIILSPIVSLSQEKMEAEIINVNHQLKIAFTDMSNLYLGIGDIVKVYNKGKLLTHLKVVETSDSVSKLVPVQGKNIYTKSTDFSKINVGNTIMKEKSSEVTMDSGNKSISGSTTTGAVRRKKR